MGVQGFIALLKQNKNIPGINRNQYCSVVFLLFYLHTIVMLLHMFKFAAI